MNAAGLAKIDEILARRATALQTQQNLIFMKNMGLLLHCSQEIDQSTLLYFSVNNLPVGEKDYVVLLFSENSKPNLGQDSGQNLYQRSYLYDLVEEVAREEFTGHYVFYTCLMDGRLVILLHFVTGLLPVLADSLMDMVADSCSHIIQTCQAQYDLHLSVHTSGVVDMRQLASSYHQLLEEVTFYRYTDVDMTGLVTGLSHGDDVQAQAAFQALQDTPEQLCAQIAAGENPKETIQALFQKLRWHPSRSIRALQREVRSMLEQTQRLLLRSGTIHEVRFPPELCSRLCEGVVDYTLLQQNIQEVLDDLAAECAKRIRDAQTSRMDEVRALVETQLQDPSLSVSSIAQQLGTTASALTQAFRRVYDITLLSYIQQQRMLLAQQLLRGTELPLREICTQCGFGSLETMHRQFRQQLGTTPSKFRHSASR